MTSRLQPNPKPRAEPEAAQVKRTALDLLARREHSALELRYKLTQRGFPADIVAGVLQELAAADLLNETRYAEVYAHSRADKGYGPLRIDRELRERGLSQDIILAVLRDLDDFWMPRLAALQRKRFGAAPADDMVKQAQQLRFLRQRGFTLDQIKQLFRNS